MSRRRRKSYTKKKRTTERPQKEFHEIWHWNDKSKRRLRVEKIDNSYIGLAKRGILIEPIDKRSDAEKLLSSFESKWLINNHSAEEIVRRELLRKLVKYPNKNEPPPKKKFFEKSSDYEKRCKDFKWLSIQPTDDMVNKELIKWKSNQKRAIESDEYKRLLQTVKDEKLNAKKKNKQRYLQLIEVEKDDSDDLGKVWAEIRECCEKDESLGKHYLSIQVEKEKAWLLEKENRKLEEEKRKKIREKQIAEKQAMFARANSASRQLGAKIKVELRSDHPCPYCNGDLGENYHADHIIPIAQGGLSVQHNMVNVCSGCNLSKGALTLYEFSKKEGFDYLKIIENLQHLGKRV